MVTPDAVFDAIDHGLASGHVVTPAGQLGHQGFPTFSMLSRPCSSSQRI